MVTAYQRLVGCSRDSRSAFRKVARERGRSPGLTFQALSVKALSRQLEKERRDLLVRRERLLLVRNLLRDESITGHADVAIRVHGRAYKPRERIPVGEMRKVGDWMRDVRGAFEKVKRLDQGEMRAELSATEKKLGTIIGGVERERLMKRAKSLIAQVKRRRKLSVRQQMALLNEEYTVEVDSGLLKVLPFSAQRYLKGKRVSLRRYMSLWQEAKARRRGREWRRPVMKVPIRGRSGQELLTTYVLKKDGWKRT